MACKDCLFMQSYIAQLININTGESIICTGQIGISFYMGKNVFGDYWCTTSTYKYLWISVDVLLFRSSSRFPDKIMFPSAWDLKGTKSGLSNRLGMVEKMYLYRAYFI